jgi:hypothetical protein
MLRGSKTPLNPLPVEPRCSPESLCFSPTAQRAAQPSHRR